jgi:hypothetical protein
VSAVRSITGVIWALGGAVVGLLVGLVAGLVIVKVTHTSSREGGDGYLMVAVALVGAVLGLLVGMLLYGRSAPAGEGVAYAGSSLLGVAGIMVAIAAGLWAFMNLREAPATYGNAMADLLIELRVRSDAIPPAEEHDWLGVEVQTPKTRPEGTVLWSQARTEGAYRIIPVSQGPLSRTTSRFIVVRIKDRQDEMFSPPMKRLPDPDADWSPWYAPGAVTPPYGVVPPVPLHAMFELRYRIRVYGR